MTARASDPDRVVTLVGTLADGTPLPPLRIRFGELADGMWVNAWTRFGARLAPGVRPAEVGDAVLALSRQPQVASGSPRLAAAVRHAAEGERPAGPAPRIARITLQRR